MPVERHAALLRVEGAGDEGQEGAFARAALAEEGDALPGGDVQRDVPQDGPGGVVPEGDVLEPQVAPHGLRQGLRAVPVLHGDGRVEHLEHPPSARLGPLEQVADVHEVVDRTVEVPPVPPVREETAERELPGHDQPRAAAQHDHVPQVPHEARAGEGAVADGDGLHAFGVQLVAQGADAVGLGVLAREALHDADAAQAVRDQRAQVPQTGARGAVRRPHRARVAAQHQRHGDHRQGRQNAQQRLQRDEDPDHPDQSQGVRQHGVRAAHQHVLQRVHVPGHAGDQVAGALPLEVRRRLPLQLPVQREAQVARERLPGPLQQQPPPRGQALLHPEHRHQQDQLPPDERPVPLRNAVIHHANPHERRVQFRRHAPQQQQQPHGHRAPVWTEQPVQAAQHGRTRGRHTGEATPPARPHL